MQFNAYIAGLTIYLASLACTCVAPALTLAAVLWGYVYAYTHVHVRARVGGHACVAYTGAWTQRCSCCAEGLHVELPLAALVVVGCGEQGGLGANAWTEDVSTPSTPVFGEPNTNLLPLNSTTT